MRGPFSISRASRQHTGISIESGSMSGSVPKLACRNRLRSCNGSIITIPSDDEVEKGKKMRDIDRKMKDINIASVFLEKEKERSKNSSGGKKTRTADDYKEGKKKKKIFIEVKNSKASPMQNEDDLEVEIWTDHSESKRRKVSSVSFEKKERRKSWNNGNRGMKIHVNGDDRGKNYVCRSDSKAHEEVTVTSFEKENKQKRPTNVNGGTKRLHVDGEKEKHLRNSDCRIRNGHSSATFIEKGEQKKRQNSTNNEKKFQGGNKKYRKDVESRKVSAASYVKEKKKKMSSHGNGDKKINGADKKTSLLLSKNKMQNKDVKKRTEQITNVVNAKKMRPTESTKMKMQHGLKQKKRDAPSDISKEKKSKAPIKCNYEKRKREKSNIVSEKVKRIQPDDKKRKIHNSEVKEKNCGDLEAKKRNTHFSFKKVVIHNNFKESLSIPPSVAPELENLTNHHVYLEDSVGNLSKIRLSVVNGYLAFHQGWNTFASDHLIEFGDFLLFEYKDEATFFVRIFGKDSRERLHFNAGRKSEGVRKKEVHTNRSHDDFISLDTESEDNGEYPSIRSKESESHHVNVDTTEYPKRVERMVRSGSSIHENDIAKLTISTADSSTKLVAADTKEDPKRVENGIGDRQSTLVGDEKGRLTDEEFRTKKATSTAQIGIDNGLSDVVDDGKGSLPDVECGTKCTSLECSEKKAASAVLSGTENGPSAVLENEKGSLPATNCTSPKCSEKKATSTVQSGTENGPSATLEHENGSSPAVVCGTRCISPMCYKNKTSVDAAPLKQENDDTSKYDLNLHDSYEISSIHLECTTAVNRYNNDGKTTASRYICRNYEAPGGFQCLEKWKKSIGRDRVILDVFDVTGPIKYESTQETGRPIKEPARPKSITCEHDGIEIDRSISRKGTCAFIELQPAVPIKNPSSPDRLSRCGERMVEVNDAIDIKGTIAKLETKMGLFEPMGSIEGIQSTNIPVYADNAAAHQSENFFFRQEDTNSIDFSTLAKPEIMTPMKPEILESDDLSVLNMKFCIPNTTQKWLVCLLRHITATTCADQTVE